MINFPYIQKKKDRRNLQFFFFKKKSHGERLLAISLSAFRADIFFLVRKVHSVSCLKWEKQAVVHVVQVSE